MRLLVVIAAFLCAAKCQPARTLDPLVPAWNVWKEKQNKVYENEVEEAVRFNIFKQNAEFVMEHNLRASLGLETFTTELNLFADLTNEEYQAQRLSKWVPGLKSEMPIYTGEGTSPPATQDWRLKGWVTPVKDQGQCGSCWSFSATGSLEGAYKNSSGTLLSFSEQQQVSCNNWCFGCNGGNADFAFHYWTKKRGANLEADYPYTSGTTEKSGTCETVGKKEITMVSYHVDVAQSMEALESAVGLVGPTSIAIDASNLSFQLYQSGIYSSNKCSSTSLDHAVLNVGYNADSDGQYWIVKNSWGTSWGQEGYIWMAKDDNDMCGVYTDASFPIV